MAKNTCSRLVVALLVALVGLVPGSVELARAAETKLIKVATLAPRNSVFMRAFMQLDQQMREYTNDAVGFRLYPSGVAGDETDVVRKMRVGQMDAAMVTSDGLGLILPEVNVLRAPGVVNTYAQLEAVQKVMLPEFDKSFEQKGFKLIAWGEAGEYRYFSRTPVTKPADIRAMRPWLWPQSPVMKEMWRVIGANPVPLGMPEVYGALQTKMLDLVQNTSIAYIALQWHTTELKYVTSEANGVLVGAWVMNKAMFDSLGPEAQKKLMELARTDNERSRQRSRDADRGAYDKLIKRGYVATHYTAQGKQEFDKVNADVRDHMKGRVYSPVLLDRVQKIASNP
jgi:TRAP-type C4-dicarboxylate transport system substrate-binding protein